MLGGEDTEAVSERIPQFGARVAAMEYRVRPGGYAIVIKAGGDIALVENAAGLFLPGGGQDPGESPEHAAIRESREECGFRISIRARIGVADELLFASDLGSHIRKRCTFFTADLIEEGAGEEPGHRVMWTAPSSAAAGLTHGSQRWAVCAAFGLPEAGTADPKALSAYSEE